MSGTSILTGFVRSTTLALLAMAVVGTTGCDNGNDTGSTGPSPVASSVVALAGNQQSGTIGLALASPLVVVVYDQEGRPLKGATVAWNVTSGGGTLASATTVSGDHGVAQNYWTLGMSAGTGTVAARVGELATQTVQFTSTAMLRQ